MAKRVTELTKTGDNNDREHMLSVSMYSLPDNPSDKNFSAGQIKSKGYKPSVLLFNWIDRLIGEINTSFSETQTDLDNLLLEVNKIKDGRTIVGKANSDRNGKTIDLWYETLNGSADKLQEAKDYADEVGEDVLQEAKEYAFDGDEATLAEAKAYGDNVTLPSAKAYAEDKDEEVVSECKSYADEVGESSVETAEGYTDAETEELKEYTDTNKVDFDDIIDNLTSTSTNKVLSANQGKVLKGHIDAIMQILQSPDTDLDTLQEIVQYIKDNKELIEEITVTKVNVSDIIDNLTSQVTNKPLSAKQGYALKGLIDLKVSIADIIDDLTSQVTNKPVSAKQAYVLKGLIDALSNSKADKSNTDTKEQVNQKITTALLNVENMNVIADVDNNKNYTWQIKITGGKAHFIATEVVTE